MQPGDVFETWADTTSLKLLTKYQPSTDIFTGFKILSSGIESTTKNELL